MNVVGYIFYLLGMICYMIVMYKFWNRAKDTKDDRNVVCALRILY